MKPKIAIITTQLPSLESGTAVRNLSLLQGLKKDFDVTLYCFLNDKVDETQFKKTVHEQTRFRYIPPFNTRQRLIDFITGRIPYVERLRRGLDALNNIPIDPDTTICLFQELNSYFVMEPFFEQLPGKKVLDAHNIEYVKLKGEINAQHTFVRLIGSHLTTVMKQEERHAAKRFDHILTCSDHDAAYYTRIASTTKITVIPNGVDTSFFKPLPLTSAHSIIFMGLLSYYPNNDALRYFIYEIYPLIKKEVPDVTFTIIGKGAQPWLVQYAMHDSSVHLEGFVSDIRPYIGNAAVCICPLRYGSGTRLKIVEYMAMGRPVVSTVVGAEGLNVVDSEHISIASTAHEFAKHVAYLLQQKHPAAAMGKKAHQLVEKSYNWNTIQKTVSRQLLQLIEDHETYHSLF